MKYYLIVLSILQCLPLVILLIRGPQRPQIPELTEAQGKVIRTLTLEEVALFEDCMFNKDKTYTDCFLRVSEPPKIRAKRKL